MRRPGILKIPLAILLLIVDFDLPVDRACRKAIAIGIIGHGLNHVLVAMGKDGKGVPITLARLSNYAGRKGGNGRYDQMILRTHQEGNWRI